MWINLEFLMEASDRMACQITYKQNIIIHAIFEPHLHIWKHQRKQNSKL